MLVWGSVRAFKSSIGGGLANLEASVNGGPNIFTQTAILSFAGTSKTKPLLVGNPEPYLCICLHKPYIMETTKNMLEMLKFRAAGKYWDLFRLLHYKKHR